ncbi:hypothetical protein ACFV1N_09670 [Streptosporangium canum]|uniref:hypothetical protein n=1 Tax=Streptosporangium canum TaxID=324952 RepID=UPI00368FB04D
MGKKRHPRRVFTPGFRAEAVVASFFAIFELVLLGIALKVDGVGILRAEDVQAGR